MSKKVIYHLASLGRRRVFESIKKDDRLEQIVLGPKVTMPNGVVAEDYSYYNLDNIKTYGSPQQAQQIINQIKPDIFVQDDTPKNLALPKKCIRAFVGHGMIGTNVIPMHKYGGAKTWRGFDLYFGATDRFRDWIWHACGDDSKVVYKDCLPQIDLLHDKNYYESYRKKILGATKNPGAKKAIMFFGFCCKDRPDFQDHLEDYYKTAIWLEKIARKNNYVVFLRPRSSLKKTIDFLKTKSWKSKYLDSYVRLTKSKYVHHIVTTNHIYRYYFSDIFVVNGCSTAELEACLINKPLIVVRSVDRKGYDPFETVGYGASLLARNYSDLANGVAACSITHPTIDKQNKLIKDREFVFDGKANERISNILCEL